MRARAFACVRALLFGIVYSPKCALALCDFRVKRIKRYKYKFLFKNGRSIRPFLMADGGRIFRRPVPCALDKNKVVILLALLRLCSENRL